MVFRGPKTEREVSLAIHVEDWIVDLWCLEYRPVMAASILSQAKCGTTL
jgi:hypothetical protein